MSRTKPRSRSLTQGMFGGGAVDTTAPTVASFTATTPSTSLDIPITAFTASEAGASFLITESSTPPLAGAAGWAGTAPTTYTVATQGTKTLYPWVKDAAGNVSSVYGSPATVDVVIYLFRDLFTTTRAAGAVNGTDAEPGPGIRNVIDTDNSRVTITPSGTLNWKGNANWQNGVYGADTALVRAMGKAVFFRFIAPASSSGAFGLSTLKTNIYLAGGTESIPVTPPNFLQFEGKGPLVTVGQEYECCIILRPTGAHYLLRGGTEYPEWSKVYTSSTLNQATNYFVVDAYHANFWKLKDVRFVQLLAPFAADYGCATNRVASASVGETITHEADGEVELTWTAVTGQVLNILFRRTDDDNCWKLECDQTNSTIKLYRREAGVDTEVNTGKTQTWTNGVAYRINIRFWGQHIVTQVATTQKHDYTTASFNTTATTAKTDRAGANFIAWPWTLSSAALSEVMRVSGPF